MSKKHRQEKKVKEKKSRGRPPLEDGKGKVQAPFRWTQHAVKALEDLTALSGGHSMGTVSEEVFWEGHAAVEARYMKRRNTVAQNPTFHSPELRGPV